MEYIIVSASDIQVLINNIKMLLSQGWELAHTPNFPAGDMRMYQALTRIKKVEVINE